jgi:hypothetical protein
MCMILCEGLSAFWIHSDFHFVRRKNGLSLGYNILLIRKGRTLSMNTNLILKFTLSKI